ncbi:MAG: tRNA (adenosine(37)-N6)-threonylcarbamoyltransferase complex dimerization subunit type 1 TsaB [Chthoniobacterales bacterium]
MSQHTEQTNPQTILHKKNRTNYELRTTGRATLQHILALDVSSPATSIAMVEFSPSGKKILYHYHELHERYNSSVFFQGLETAIKQCGLPTRIVVGQGPGSYNGLRASIAAAQGMATALHVDLIGISSPLAIPGPSTGYWVGGDARGGHYWLAAIAQNHFLEEPFLLAPSAVAEELATQPNFPFFSSAELPQLSSSQKTIIATPDAALLATLGQHAEPSPNIPEPLYLKPPNIGPALTPRP